MAASMSASSVPPDVSAEPSLRATRHYALLAMARASGVRKDARHSAFGVYLSGCKRAICQRGIYGHGGGKNAVALTL